MEMKSAFKSDIGKRDIIAYYDYLFEKSNCDYERFMVNTSYGRTYITAYGDKGLPPLILLHGSAMNSIMWVNDIKQYSKNHRVYAVDIPGEPGKSDDLQLPLAGPHYADWLKDVLEALSIDKAIIKGISLGGWLAAKFAIAYPERVKNLILLCPAGIGPQKKSFLFKAIGYMLLGEMGSELLYKKVNGNKAMPEEILKFQKMIGQHFNYRMETIPLFSDEELQGLTMPVILFVGRKDVMLHSDKTARRLGKLVPHAKINILQDAGHTLINLADAIKEQI